MRTEINHVIEINNSQSKIEISKSHLNLIKKAAIQALDYEGIAYSCEIGIEIIDNNKIQPINNGYRGKDAPTDVLSFPMIDAYKIPRLKDYVDDGYFDEDINPENEALMTGSILISAEKAMEQSIEFNQTFERELAFLTVHAVLHLLGYDHELSDEDDAVMRKKQRDILDLL